MRSTGEEGVWTAHSKRRRGSSICGSADSGIVYGKITDVYQNGASDVYSIRREDGTELMFPCIDEVVLKTDIDAGEMIIRPLPGLFEDAVDGDGDGE